MPAVSLFQSRFSHQLELELEDDAVVVTDRAMTRSRKYRVPLEHLALTAEEVTVWSQRRLALTCLCLGLLVLVAIIRIDGGDVGADAELFYAVLAALGLGAFIGSRQTYLITQGHPPLVVMKNKPSPLAVTAFPIATALLPMPAGMSKSVEKSFVFAPGGAALATSR